MTPLLNSTTQKIETLSAPAGTAANPSRANPRCLIVNDDLEIRLKLAGLVRKAHAKLDADTLGATALDNLSVDQLRAYSVVLLIVEFVSREGAADPLAPVARLSARMPKMPIFVFARHGSERWAARSIKAGASDYWPMHSVDIPEFAAALQPLLAPAAIPPTSAASAPSVHAQGQANLPEVAGYRLMKRIAQSSAATVYLARNDDLAQPVALKLQPIKGSDGVSDEDRERFARECEILTRLNHRSIADVIDFGVTPEYLFLALEYFPCGSMRERMKNPVSEVDALDYVRQIAEALRIVHGAGVVHRDLKPSNLMLTTDNRIVLIDFGSARAQLLAHDVSRSNLMTGTPYYVSPEQIDGRNTDQRSDLYSLGVVFYEMLAGTLPFKGASLAEIFAAHRAAAVPVLGPEHARFQPLINRLMAKNPDERYASAAQFIQALDSVSGPPPRELRQPEQRGTGNS